MLERKNAVAWIENSADEFNSWINTPEERISTLEYWSEKTFQNEKWWAKMMGTAWKSNREYSDKV